MNLKGRYYSYKKETHITEFGCKGKQVTDHTDCFFFLFKGLKALHLSQLFFTLGKLHELKSCHLPLELIVS